MSTHIRMRFAILMTSLGLGVSLACAAPPAKEGPSKASPKIEQPKLEAKPKVLPKLEAKPPVVVAPKFEPPIVKKPVVVKPELPKVVDIKKPTPPQAPIVVKPEVPKVIGIKKPTPPQAPIVVQEKPKGLGIKLPAGTKIDQAEIAKIKPPIDLKKTKPEVVLASKPANDFKVKPIALDKIQIPQNAAKVNKLNVNTVSAKQSFVVNASFYSGGDYHTKFGTKAAFGFYYSGHHHSHWHHSIWDPCFNTHYYYCPSACCYYYWNGGSSCYYPCHWFVDYGSHYYPWWLYGGHAHYGYVTVPSVSVYIGW